MKTETSIHPDGTEYITFEHDDGRFEFTIRGGPVRVPDTGNAFGCHYVNDDLALITQLAIADARRELAPGTVFEVRGRPRPVADSSKDFGRVPWTLAEQQAEFGIAWIVQDGMRQEPLFEADVATAEFLPIRGYILIARLRA